MNENLTAARDLANGLDVLVAMQKQVSIPVPGAIVTGAAWPSKDAVRTYSLAMIVEIAEWLQTLDWKPWKNAGVEAHPWQQADIIADEFADILAFLGILTHYMDQWNITTEDIAAAYIRKSAENVRRINGAHLRGDE